MKKEPLVTRASIVAIVAAVLGVAVSFGAPISADQKQQILGLAAVLAPIAVAVLARSKVAPWVTVVAQRGEDGEVVAGPASTIANGTPVDVSAIDSLPGPLRLEPPVDH